MAQKIDPVMSIRRPLAPNDLSGASLERLRNTCQQEKLHCWEQMERLVHPNLTKLPCGSQGDILGG